MKFKKKRKKNYKILMKVENNINYGNVIKMTVFPKAVYIFNVQFSSVAQSCPTLCDPVNRSTPGLPVHHQLPEFTQTHVH